MRRIIPVALGTCLLGTGALSAGPALAHHEMKAHEHGRGTLNIAIEGSRVSMEFEASGADIVGFEHAARTARQKEAVEKGKTQLLAVQNLFKLPAAAGCVVTDAKVDLEDGDHDHAAGQTKAKKTDAHADDHAHSGFHGQYALSCTAPEKITAIEFGYFRAFSGAQKLDVNVITPKGQSTFEVSRSKPRIDLGGMM